MSVESAFGPSRTPWGRFWNGAFQWTWDRRTAGGSRRLWSAAMFVCAVALGDEWRRFRRAMSA